MKTALSYYQFNSLVFFFIMRCGLIQIPQKQVAVS